MDSSNRKRHLLRICHTLLYCPIHSSVKLATARSAPLALMGSRRGLEDGVPVALVIFAFLSTPAAPEDAPDPNLDMAAAFLFLSKIIFALLTASVGAGPGFSSG